MRRRRIPVLPAAFSLLCLLALAAAFVAIHPAIGLPPHWNPLAPLNVAAPATLLTRFKLRRSDAPEACFAALDTSQAIYQRLPKLEAEGACGISNRVRLSRVGDLQMDPVETTCAIALRLAMWERHGLQPQARAQLGSEITRIRHYSSYNCRPMRTSQGGTGRLSAHATAEAIDISGFVLRDGRPLDLDSGWGDPRYSNFWRSVFSGACRWFETSLGPDYNDLHADHFHLQSTGRGICR
ncbi:MAG: extensin family protein [Rhodobacteraceae bacterium]|nr:extensin family protein [Paracoccaceae bacterium]